MGQHQLIPTFYTLDDETIVDQLVKAHKTRPDLVTEEDVGLAMIRFNISEETSRALCLLNGITFDDNELTE